MQASCRFIVNKLHINVLASEFNAHTGARLGAFTFLRIRSGELSQLFFEY
jgi:hypothetical protein